MSTLNSLSEWLQYLERVHSKSIDLSLDRVKKVAADLLNPRFNCPVVTVAGTNGKGTTVAALHALALKNNWRVGVYTSPHLFHFNERVVIDQKPVSDALLITAFEQVEAVRAETSLTYFEYITLTALWLFQQTSLDLVILEVGMGGRLDATNVIDADIAIITRIALDHMAYLGDTRELIAFEKAGIMRPHQKVIYGGEDLIELFQTWANEKNAYLSSYLKDFFASDEILQASYNTYIPVPNLCCAYEAGRQLGLNLNQDPFKYLSLTKPLGRFTRRGKVIFDVAHNPDAMSLLAKHLESLPERDIRMVIGMLEDKDHAASLAHFQDNPRYSFYFASPKSSRSAPVGALLSVLPQGRGFKSLKEAFEAAQLGASEDTLWVVTGSFYTVGELGYDILL